MEFNVRHRIYKCFYMLLHAMAPKTCKNTCFLMGCNVKYRIFEWLWAQDAFWEAQNDLLGAHNGALEPFSQKYIKKGCLKKISLWSFWGPFLDPILLLLAAIFEV